MKKQKQKKIREGKLVWKRFPNKPIDFEYVWLGREWHSTGRTRSHATGEVIESLDADPEY